MRPFTEGTSEIIRCVLQHKTLQASGAQRADVERLLLNSETYFSGQSFRTVWRLDLRHYSVRLTTEQRSQLKKPHRRLNASTLPGLQTQRATSRQK